jgi:hypothetical protein
MFRPFRAFALVAVLGVPLALSACAGEPSDASGEAVTPEQAREIAREAYVYGFPIVDGHRIMYAYFMNPESPSYRGPWNQIHSDARVYTPADKDVQTPNSDTPYSMLGMDLRAEPLVLTIPPMKEDRYFTVQLVDAYTFNFDYIGTRTTGNGGGTYLVAGPNWDGETPPGIDRVFRSETEIALGIYRTQLFGPDDLENVKKVQAGYEVEPLSAFLGEPAPEPPAPLDWSAPLTAEEQRTSLVFFDQLNAMLAYCPVHPSEQELRTRFARIGVEAGKTFDPDALSPEIRTAIEEGMSDAWQTFDALNENEVATGKVTSGDMFGTREFLNNNYLYRMAGAAIGIYGNSREEAIYPIYKADANGAPLDGSSASYRLRFAPGQAPPAESFASLTLYEMPASLLYANPIDRYLINSPMLDDLVRDDDGGVTIYVQHESPGADREANWLPAPAGPFIVVMRLYLPGPTALDGSWTPPPLEPVMD